MSSSVTSINTQMGVKQALYNAAARSGVSFDFLLNQARVESGLNPDARSLTSTATGLYQFIEQSWLATVARHGEEYGLGWAASPVEKGSDGRYRIADPETRHAVLDLRRDPAASASMAAAFARDNSAHLESRLGRPVEPVDLYLAHFLGAGGATKFLRQMDSAPQTAAASVMPAAARSNPRIFYRRDGTPRSLAEVRDRFAAKLTPRGVSSPSPQPQWVRNFARPGPASANARLTYLMLASMGVSA